MDTGRVNKSAVASYPSDTYTSPNDYIQQLSGGGAKIGAGLHETFHTLGLTDNYDPRTGYKPKPGHTGDIIGDPSRYNRTDQRHFNAWGSFILNQGQNNFIFNKRVN